MTIVYGLTDQGLVVKSRLIIRDDINSALRLTFGNSINLSDRSILGQLVGIISDRLGELWELLEQVASSQDPSKATHSLLDALSLLTGTLRPAAQPSAVILTLTGVDTTVIAAGSEFATLSTLKNFATVDIATLVAVANWVTLTAYIVDDRVVASSNVYQCIQAGTSGATGGPSGFTPDFTLDGTCLWTFLGEGAAAADVEADSVDLGPIVATAKDITVIITSIGGLQGVTNLVDASLGRLVAEDGELRELRVAELATAGSSPFDALRAELLELVNVTSVTLFPNNTDVTDADGVPPHSVEALIRGGDDQVIFDRLLASIAAGIGTFGNTSGTAIDSQGDAQVMNFSRPVTIPVFVRMTVVTDANFYPLDGDDQVENAIIAYGAIQSTGRDVVAAAVSSQAFTIAGVLDVSQVLLYTDVIGVPVAWAISTAYVATVGSRSVVTNGGLAYICITAGTSAGSGGPTGTGLDITDGTVHWRYLGNPIVITTRQLATYSTANTTITSTTGTP